MQLDGQPATVVVQGSKQATASADVPADASFLSAQDPFLTTTRQVRQLRAL